MAEQTEKTADETADSEAEESDVETQGEKEAKTVERKPTTVPLGALDEERSRRRELQEELSRTRADNDRKIGRMESILDQIRADRAKPAEAAAPDWETDPAGAARHAVESLGKRFGDFEKHIQGQGQASAAAQQDQRIADYLRGAAAEFAKAQPDFGAAYQHLWNDRMAELNEIGYDYATALAIVNADEKGLVAQAAASGKNPAERIYALARRRGYKAAKVEDEDKIETLQKGEKAAKSLSGAGGAVEGKMTLERLADLEGDEYLREFEKMKNKGLLG